jgi:hypothetical protein
VREYAALVPALVASVVLHAGGATLAEATLGSVTPGPGPATAGRPYHLHATLTGTASRAVPAPQAASGEVIRPGQAAGRGLIDLPLPYYFPPHELDRKPEAAGDVPLAYPADMPQVAHSRVVLSLLIDERGDVDKVIVETADAPTELAQLASRAFAGVRFNPGMRDGAAVKSRLRVEVTFESE